MQDADEADDESDPALVGPAGDAADLEDSGRETGAASRISLNSSPGIAQQSAHHPEDMAGKDNNAKIWSKFQKQVRRFGGSTGSLSSSSPNSEEHHPLPPASGGTASLPRNATCVYSPEVADMESPKEGGFRSTEQSPQSVALLRSQIQGRGGG